MTEAMVDSHSVEEPSYDKVPMSKSTVYDIIL